MDAIKVDDLVNGNGKKQPETIDELLEEMQKWREEIAELKCALKDERHMLRDMQRHIFRLERNLNTAKSNFRKYARLFADKFKEIDKSVQCAEGRFYYDGREILYVIEYSADPDDENAPQMISGVLKNGDPITIAADDEKLEIIKE